MDCTLSIIAGGHGLQGLLDVPEHPKGLVIFVDGTGRGRLSSRNSQIAAGLRRAELATLRVDLLDPGRESDRCGVLDIALLGSRLREVTDWIDRVQVQVLKDLPVGYFCSGTGTAVAMFEASRFDDRAAAVVSRSGRPDLVSPAALAHVRAPTLLIVDNNDAFAVTFNRDAIQHMRAEASLVIVPGADRLLGEPGALDRVIDHASRWFCRHFEGLAYERQSVRVS